MNDQCPKCKGQNTVRHTDCILRKQQKYLVQCFDCNYFWKIKWNKEIENE